MVITLVKMMTRLAMLIAVTYGASTQRKISLMRLYSTHDDKVPSQNGP